MKDCVGLEEAEAVVTDRLRPNLTQREYNALVSLALDVGAEEFINSPLVAALDEVASLTEALEGAENPERMSELEDKRDAARVKAASLFTGKGTSFELTEQRVREAAHYAGITSGRVIKDGFSVEIAPVVRPEPSKRVPTGRSVPGK